MGYYLRRLGKSFLLRCGVKKNYFLNDWSIDARLTIVNEARRLGKRVVLYLIESQSNTARYRCINVMEATFKSTEWQAVFFYLDEWVYINKVIKCGDLVVLVRTSLSRVIRRVIDLDNNILYDVDDLVFHREWLPKLLAGMGVNDDRKKRFWQGYVLSQERTADLVDGFLCTNDFLGKKLERSFRKPYKVIPNSLNDKQVEVSERTVADGGKEHKGFVVGYFSGSPTHAKDFALVESELLKFLETHNDAKLRVVGYMKFSPEIQKMIDTGRVETCGVVDYLELQKLMTEVDVNIAPLVINDFTNCKSELKFFEAAVVETTTIASPTYAFKKAIKDGENGFLAQPGDWYSKLKYLYEHPKENRKVALAAKEYALKHYYGKEFLREVEEAYDYFAK